MWDKNMVKQAAADKIVEAVQFAGVLGVTASDNGLKFSGSLLLNIRDAMFHFKAMCDFLECDEEHAKRHYYSLLEHLMRGEKDAVISYGKIVVDAVFELMQTEEFHELFGKEEIQLLRQYTHGIKNTFLDLRRSGMHVPEKKGKSVEEAWTDTTLYTKKILEICRRKSVSLF